MTKLKEVLEKVKKEDTLPADRFMTLGDVEVAAGRQIMMGDKVIGTIYSKGQKGDKALLTNVQADQMAHFVAQLLSNQETDVEL
jgi:hypothetical protein